MKEDINLYQIELKSFKLSEGKIAHYEYFLLMAQYFQKFFDEDVSNASVGGKRLTLFIIVLT